MKIKSVNAYSKDNKKFVVFTLDNGNVFYCNYGLVKFALDNIKVIKKDK